MHESGLRSLMDAKAREDWDRSISEGNIPELTDANIRSTFAMRPRRTRRYLRA